MHSVYIVAMSLASCLASRKSHSTKQEDPAEQVDKKVDKEAEQVGQ